ncbi:unnamed protein product [Mesocestoides corti]|uniref:Uncharacterized protein n=2 Tax=Mesocestoides corti TaxID=53468 RepID=A0A0R3U8G9_MESCO|nr:unnamed protein product [Mesocestoides corti]
MGVFAHYPTLHLSLWENPLLVWFLQPMGTGPPATPYPSIGNAGDPSAKHTHCVPNRLLLPGCEMLGLSQCCGPCFFGSHFKCRASGSSNHSQLPLPPTAVYILQNNDENDEKQ